MQYVAGILIAFAVLSSCEPDAIRACKRACEPVAMRSSGLLTGCTCANGDSTDGK